MEPLVVAVVFYVAVFVLSELSRRVLDAVVRPHSLAATFAYELVATAQMCTCVYENAVIIRHYGILGFFIAVMGLLLVGAAVNRNAFVSPLAPLELFYFGSIDWKRLTALLTAQVVGGYSAFRIARQLWYLSLSLSDDHSHFFHTGESCALAYKVPYLYVAGFEVAGCFVLRVLIHLLPLKYKHYCIPVLVSSFLSFALLYIGVPGLNPTVASSRLQGCQGMSLSWFLFTYWLCPIVGSLAAAILLSSGSTTIKKRQ